MRSCVRSAALLAATCASVLGSTGARPATPTEPAGRDRTADAEGGPAAAGAARAMTIGEAFERWDGGGELLLRPDGAGAQRSFPTATVGAAFAAGAPASDDRYRGAGLIQFAEGRVQIETYPGEGPEGASPRLGFAERSNIGPLAHTITSGRCRLTLRATTLVPQDGRWTEARALPGSATLSETTVHTDPGTVAAVNALMERMASRKGSPLGGAAGGPTFYRELSEAAIRVTLDPAYAADVADRCPRSAGTVVFSRDAVHLRLPWRGGSSPTPGLARDPERRVTTLILQNAECRTELRILRELSVDGAWIASPLAPVPPPLRVP